MTREGKGFLISGITLLGMAVALTFHFYQGHVLHHGWPYNTFFFRPDDAYTDFFLIFSAVRSGLGPYSLKANMYFPFAYVPIYMTMGLKPVIAFFLFIAAFLGTAIWFVRSYLVECSAVAQTLTITALVFVSYPVWYCINRGNLEMVVFIVLAFFIRAYEKKQFTLAVILLSLAGAMKFYPLALGVLFLADRKYKEVALTAVLTIVAMALPLAFFPGGFKSSLMDWGGNLHILQRALKGGLVGLSYSCSLYAVLMHLGHFIFNQPYPVVYHEIEWIYPAGCLALFAALVVYCMRLETIFWRRVTLLTFCMLLFPQLSLDYKLIHLLLPIMPFIAAPPDRHDRLYAWLFGLLLIPKAYYFIAADTHVGVFVNPVLMGVFAVCLVVNRMTQTSLMQRI